MSLMGTTEWWNDGKFVEKPKLDRSRKWPFLLAFLFLRLMAFTPCMVSQTKSTPVKQAAARSAWAKKTLKQLSLEEKVGQLIMPAFRGIYLNSHSLEFKEIERQIQKNRVGGFILFAGDVY